MVQHYALVWNLISSQSEGSAEVSMAVSVPELCARKKKPNESYNSLFRVNVAVVS